MEMPVQLILRLAPYAKMVPLTHKLLPNHTQLLTARVKPTTTLMELLANAHNAVLVIRQLVERKLQQHQRKLGVIFAIRTTMEKQLQLQLVLVDVNNAPPMQSLLRNHHRLPQQLLTASALWTHMLMGSQPTLQAHARVVHQMP